MKIHFVFSPHMEEEFICQNSDSTSEWEEDDIEFLGEKFSDFSPTKRKREFDPFEDFDTENRDKKKAKKYDEFEERLNSVDEGGSIFRRFYEVNWYNVGNQNTFVREDREKYLNHQLIERSAIKIGVNYQAIIPPLRKKKVKKKKRKKKMEKISKPDSRKDDKILWVCNKVNEVELGKYLKISRSLLKSNEDERYEELFTESLIQILHNNQYDIKKSIEYVKKNKFDIPTENRQSFILDALFQIDRTMKIKQKEVEDDEEP